MQHNVLINIDSEFDLENILAAAQRVGQAARVLIRINPDVDPQVGCAGVEGSRGACKTSVLLDAGLVSGRLLCIRGGASRGSARLEPPSRQPRDSQASGQIWLYTT